MSKVGNLKYIRHFGMMAEEFAVWQHGGLVVGVDEAGRGPLAGPVVAAAVILDPTNTRPLVGAYDSKRLNESTRISLAKAIRSHALGLGVGFASNVEIDDMNILAATKLAIHRAAAIAVAEIEDVGIPLSTMLIDGRGMTLENDHWDVSQKCIVKGDQLSLSVACASIIAKTDRDRAMEQYHDMYPVYGFNRHKGYGTVAHLEVLKRHGPCSIHRRTFSPIREILGGS